MDGRSALPQRIVPDGCAELILNLDQPLEAFQDGVWQAQPRLFFAGQITGPLLLRPAGAVRVMGIGFHPHGAARLFAHPMHELRGRFAPIEELSRPLFRDLARALDSPQPFAALETALLAAAGRTPAPDLRVAEAVRRLDCRPATDLGQLASGLGLSLRQLERRFRAAVGLSPRLFGSIRRFHRVFRLLDSASPNWAGAAVACGYYDQSHLIRDCRSFSESTPAVLLSADGDLARHFYQREAASRLYNTAVRRPA